jgi:hypothetical protein
MGREEKIREIKVKNLQSYDVIVGQTDRAIWDAAYEQGQKELWERLHESCTCGLPPFTAKVIDCAGCLAELTAELEGK